MCFWRTLPPSGAKLAGERACCVEMTYSYRGDENDIARRFEMAFELKVCVERLKPWIIRTPLVEIESLSEMTGRSVYLKLEGLQRSGSFKFRGAMNYMLTLDEAEARRGVITASSGNHGLGMSLSGKLRGIRCIVVMPTSAPLAKQDKAKLYGAELVLHGTCYDDAQEYALELASRAGYTYVPSFNHAAIIEGQGTILDEILMDLPQADTVFVPVGGGGMLAGLLLAKAQLGSGLEVVGVEPWGAAGMTASLQAGRLTTTKDMQTIADGVAVRTPGDLNFEIAQRYRPKMWCVSDEQISEAQKIVLREAKMLIETAGAVPIAGLLSRHLPDRAKHVVCVVSGANVDPSTLRELCQ